MAVGAMIGSAIGGAAAAVMGGDVLQGMLNGAISGAIGGGFGYIGQCIGGWVAAGVCGAAAGALSSAITGGDVGMGAIIGGVTGAIGGMIREASGNGKIEGFAEKHASELANSSGTNHTPGGTAAASDEAVRKVAVKMTIGHTFEDKSMLQSLDSVRKEMERIFNDFLDQYYGNEEFGMEVEFVKLKPEAVEGWKENLGVTFPKEGPIQIKLFGSDKLNPRIGCGSSGSWQMSLNPENIRAYAHRLGKTNIQGYGGVMAHEATIHQPGVRGSIFTGGHFHETGWVDAADPGVRGIGGVFSKELVQAYAKRIKLE